MTRNRAPANKSAWSPLPPPSGSPVPNDIAPYLLTALKELWALAATPSCRCRPGSDRTVIEPDD